MKTKRHITHEVLSGTMICLLLILVASFSFGQTLSLTTTSNQPVSGTICPKIGTIYDLTNVPSGCVANWSVTNGQLNYPNDGRTEMSVTWDDTPGATATLSVTFSGDHCNASSTTWSALILSVNGQSFGGSSSSTVNVDYCTTQSVSLTVPPMYVQGTGGAGQPPIQEVVYDWTLPAGWAASSGTLTTVPNIVIHPTGCARPGAVQVRGTIYNRCGSAAESAAVTFNLTSAQPGVTITVPQGYSGSTACNTTPVTFTAYVNPNVGCVSGYNWSQYPSGWTLLSQSGNTATFRPSGTSADSDPNSPFKVTVNYSCGTSIVSGGYNPAFIAPTVTGPSTVCSSGTSFTVSNVTSQAFPINWSSSDASIVSFPNPTSTGASNTVNIGVNGNATISATTSCGVVATPINVYAGLPSMTLSNDGGTGPYPLCGTGSLAYTAMQDHIISASLGGATSVNYSLNGPAGVVSGSALSATAYDYISQSSTANFSITAATSNSCGSVSQCLSFSNGTCSAPTISSTTINGSTWYGDCQSNYFTFSTGTWYTITVNPNPAGTPVSFYVNDYYVISQTLSSTQFRVKCSNASESFAVIASVSNGCGTNSQCIWFSNSGVGAPKSVIRPPEGAIVIRAYPNPVSSILHVQLVDSLSSSLKLNQVYQLNLVNKFSQTVYSIQSSDKNIQIPVDRFPSDIYYLNVFYGDAVLREQIVIGK